MLIKLDSGKLLNISAVSYISNTEMLAYFKQPVITNEDSFQTAKCFGITTRQLAHLLQDNNVSLAKLDDFAERVGIDPWDLIRPSESK